MPVYTPRFSEQPVHLSRVLLPEWVSSFRWWQKWESYADLREPFWTCSRKLQGKGRQNLSSVTRSRAPQRLRNQQATLCHRVHTDVSYRLILLFFRTPPPTHTREARGHLT